VAPSTTAPARGGFDARSGDRATIPDATAKARTQLTARLGLQSSVSADPVTGGLRSVGRTDGFLTAPSGDDGSAIALDYVRDHTAAFGLDAGDIASLKLSSQTTSPDDVTHITFQQRTDGVPAYDSALTANVTRDGRLINLTGAPVHDLQPPSTDPPLGPSAARSAAQRNLGMTTDGAAGTVGTDAVRTTTFPNGDRASLVTVADPDGDHLAWSMTVEGPKPYLYEMVVDAASGTVLTRHSLTDFAFSAQVVGHHPGASGTASDGVSGGTATSYTMPSGWFESSTPSRLAGPNAHAYADRTAPDGISSDSETPPSSGTDFIYPVTAVSPASGSIHCSTYATSAPCTWNGSAAGSAAINVNQATTQVFFYVNRFHDWLAQDPIGFTPASFNFQDTDPVNVETDDYSGFNNANMSTPTDGAPGRMQMYLFSSPSSGYPAVNGGDDGSVVYHEYAHGLTNRLVGNDGHADGLETRQSEAMGEGWSDWYAMDYLVRQGLVSDTDADGDVVLGAYVTNNPNTGIRENALDCPVGSTDAAHCPGTPSAGAGGFTYADLGRIIAAGPNPYFEVHADGEIWSETLWDLRRVLGATTARGLITSALRLSPKQPSFLTMRDAILQADVAAGGTHRAEIWQVFATRGMGFGAKTTSANAGLAKASFLTPPGAATGTTTVTSPAPLGDGDTSIEPGEAALVAVPIVNPGTTALTNVRATLTTSTAGVVVGRSTVGYGTIAAGAAATSNLPFAITIPSTVPCATVVALTITVTSDQGSLLSEPISVPTGGGSATTASTQVPKAIPDNNKSSTSATSALSIATPGRVGHVRITLSVTHTAAGDLHAFLISPEGTLVTLVEAAGVIGPSAANGLTGIVLDDDAVNSIQDVPSGEGPAITGTYSPDEPLSRFADESRVGTWTLRVVDIDTGDTGALTAWSLSTDQPTCSATGPALPSATTGGAAPADTSATVAGTVSAAGTATSAAFEYGTTADYGATTGAAGADGATAATLTGLTPSTTYHYRSIALRGGTPVAVGADQAFTTTPRPGAKPPAVAPVIPKPIAPPLKLTVSKLATVLTADRIGRLSVSFRLPAAVAASGTRSGTVTLKSAKKLRYGKSRRKRTLTAGSARFTIPASGKVKVTLKLSAVARSYLRSHRSLKVKASFKIGKTTITKTITVKSYKKKK
jgi:subtilisin-like proprotein convertase family protein